MNHTMNALSALLQRNEGEAKTDDYTGEDGLLHCGKCHAPRQMHAPDYIRKTTGESVVWIPCDCEANERATLRQQREQERREQQLRTLKVNGFSDVSMPYTRISQPMHTPTTIFPVGAAPANRPLCRWRSWTASRKTPPAPALLWCSGGGAVP